MAARGPELKFNQLMRQAWPVLWEAIRQGRTVTYTEWPDARAARCTTGRSTGNCCGKCHFAAAESAYPTWRHWLCVKIPADLAVAGTT